ncbi:MAG: glycosyltransferase family 1 protein, partial [Lapillicoccus sp.]
DHVHISPSWTGRPPARLLWEQAGLPRLVRRVRPDVVHSPHYTMPLASVLDRRVRHVVTVHDATFFSHPQLHVPVKARFFRSWTAVSTRVADAVIVPSVATRDEVVRQTGVDPCDVVVIHHGVNHHRFRRPSPEEVERVRTWLGLVPGQGYVAFLGTLEPRKNVPALVDAFVAACSRRPSPPALVLAGGKGWDHTIDDAVGRVPSQLRVIRPGFVPDDLVPALIGGSDVLAYPALGEGFGLPVLEAMACGAPVLTTRRLSLPEVGGDAVRYADSPDAADLARALSALLDDEHERDRLREAGPARAASFTWEAAAGAHAHVYEQVVR